MGESEPQTLAAGELVWAKTKGRQNWWPARLLLAAAASSPKDAPVACFGDDDEERRAATRLRRFADPAADKMARASTALGFLNALQVAHAAAVALLCTGLTCACASSPAAPPAAGAAEGALVVSGVDNLSPSEFLASIRRAALDAPAVGLVDRARLKSWARALAQGWGPAGAGHYPRRTPEELVDKIDLDDLNEPAGEEGDAADEDSDKALKTPAQGKRRGRPRKQDTPLTEDTDAAMKNTDQKDEQKEESAGPETELSTGRKRKKSKYLSPPYTNLGVYVLEEKTDKSADLPKESVPSATKAEKKASRDNVDAGEVLELVCSFGEDVLHEGQFPKAVERFLGSLRSSTFAGVDVAAGLVSDSGAALKIGKSVLERSRKKDEAGVGGSSVKRKKKLEKTSPTATLDFPAENVVAKDSADVAGVASDSSAALEKEKGVVKRGRKKKDQDGSGGSSIKKKKVEKTPPKSTPEHPAENVSANVSADGTGLVPHSCATVEQVKKRGRKKKDQDGTGASPLKRKRMKKTSPTAILDSGLVITPAIPIRQLRAGDLISQVKSGGGAGMEVGVLDQDMLQFKSPIPAAVSEGMKSGEEQDQANGGSVVKTQVTVEATNVENVVTDLPAKSVQAEETKPGMGIQVDMNEQSGIVENAVTDLPAKSIQTEETKPGMGIQVDMNVQSGIVDVPIRSAHMEAMELETNIPGVEADVAVRSGLPPKHGGISQLTDANIEACEQTSQTAVEALANHAPAVSTNGIYSDAPNSTPKRRNKKAPQYIANPAPQPFANTAPQPFANAAPQPFANAAPQPFANPALQPFANPAPQPFANAAPQYFANPVEIVLQFTDGVITPSKEELLAAFSKFGILIESMSDILEDIHGARVVFGKSAEADAVYAKRETPGIFGQFGPPFATLKVLNYLPPFTPSIPPLGVNDMKKNVANMMSSLAGQNAAATSSGGTNPVQGYLFGEMQQFMAKLDNVQPGPSSSASAPQ